MKRTWILAPTLFVMVLATGCGNAILETPSGATVLNESYTDAIPVESQLIVGTLNLEGTDLAVDAAMAQDLLPLWQTLRALENSDTAAMEEKTAVLEQIQQTMTPAQIQAIRDMQLTQQTMVEVMKKQGMTMFGNRGGTTSSGMPSAQDGNFPADGFIPGDGAGEMIDRGGASGGGMPPAGGTFPGGGQGFSMDQGNQNLSEEQIATLRAGRSQNGSGGGGGLIDALIRFLQQQINPVATGTPLAP